MAPAEVIQAIRPALQKELGSRAVLTQAIDDMLEVLPRDANKGYGLRLLLNSLGVDPSNVIALGDGENDIEV
jgi:HAD superfamily hydrolase (TIGR01484 family)